MGYQIHWWIIAFPMNNGHDMWGTHHSQTSTSYSQVLCLMIFTIYYILYIISIYIYTILKFLHILVFFPLCWWNLQFLTLYKTSPKTLRRIAGWLGDGDAQRWSAEPNCWHGWFWKSRLLEMTSMSTESNLIDIELFHRWFAWCRRSWNTHSSTTSLT